MHLSQQLSVALVVLSTASALPWKRSNTFTANQNIRKSANAPSFKSKMSAVYDKYQSKMPVKLTARLDALEVFGSVPATSEEGGLLYDVALTIGGQVLNLDLDTGSSDLWVFSPLLSPSINSGHSIYNPSLSNTSQLLQGYTFGLNYGLGSASGIVYTDVVSIGGATVQAQAVELATNISSNFISQPSDGLIGMAFDQGNSVQPVPQKTFFSNLMSSLPSPLFTASLNTTGPGSYDFGFIDPSKYTGAITYSPVLPTNPGYWEVQIDGTVINGSTIANSFTGIMDTGTSLTFLPQSVLDAYFAGVPGALAAQANTGMYEYSCNATLQDLVFIYAGVEVIVPAQFITVQQISATTCISGFQPNTALGPGVNNLSIFGDTFLSTQFVVFYGGSAPAVGLAARPGSE